MALPHLLSVINSIHYLKIKIHMHAYHNTEKEHFPFDVVPVNNFYVLTIMTIHFNFCGLHYGLVYLITHARVCKLNIYTCTLQCMHTHLESSVQ